MVKISDFYGNWIIESRSTIFFESTFIIIDEKKLSIFLGPINYVRTNHFYDLIYTFGNRSPSFPVNYKLIGDELYIENNSYWICSFRDGNKDELQFTSYSGFGFPTTKKPYLTAVYFKRLNSIPETLTQSIEFTNAINWNNPKLLLNYWISHFKCSYNIIPHLGTNYYSNKKFTIIS